MPAVVKLCVKQVGESTPEKWFKEQGKTFNFFFIYNKYQGYFKTRIFDLCHFFKTYNFFFKKKKKWNWDGITVEEYKI